MRAKDPNGLADFFLFSESEADGMCRLEKPEETDLMAFQFF
jgi:hypothetical protein